MTIKTKLWIGLAALVASSTVLAQQEQVPTYGPLRQPAPVPGAKPVNQPAIEALKGDGLFYIDGSRIANLKASATPGQGNRHALTETSSDAAQSTSTSGQQSQTATQDIKADVGVNWMAQLLLALFGQQQSSGAGGGSGQPAASTAPQSADLSAESSSVPSSRPAVEPEPTKEAATP